MVVTCPARHVTICPECEPQWSCPQPFSFSARVYSQFLAPHRRPPHRALAAKVTSLAPNCQVLGSDFFKTVDRVHFMHYDHCPFGNPCQHSTFADMNQTTTEALKVSSSLGRDRGG